MDFDKTVLLLKQKHDDNKDKLTYAQIHQKLQRITDSDIINDLLKQLLKMFSQNIERDKFFALDFPVILFKLGLLKYENDKIFQICAVILRKILSETPESSKKLEDQILKYLHKSRYNETLQFYILLGNICTSPTSSETILHSPIPNLLVKFYHSKISSQCKNTQLFESLDLVTMKNRIDESDSESQKSGATMLSSLSLDEDIAYKRNDNNGEPLSARSILSDFGNTLLDDEDDQKQKQEEEMYSDRDKDFDNQSMDNEGISGDISQPSRQDDMSIMEDNVSMGNHKQPSQESFHMTNDHLDNISPNTTSNKISELKQLPQKVQIAKNDMFEIEPNQRPNISEENSRNSQDFTEDQHLSDHDPHSVSESKSKTDEQKLFTKNNTHRDIEIPVKETQSKSQLFPDQFNQTETADLCKILEAKPQRIVLAIAGPLCQAVYNKPKPKNVPQLNLKIIGDMTPETLQEGINQNREIEADNYANPLASPTRLLISPMAKSKKNNEDIDQTFKKQLEYINQQRKGSIIINEIGNLIGQFIAMSDYPLISNIIKNENQDAVIIPKPINSASIYIEKYFGDQNSREVSDYNFTFSYLHKIMGIQDTFDVQDIQRLGILYVLHTLIKNSPQLTVQTLPSTHVMFTYDMIQLRSQKQGFLPASLLAIHTFVADITQAKLVLQMDLWTQALTQMHTHVSNDYEYINVFNEKLTESNDPDSYERRNINLPSLVFLLERLEGTRRKMVLELRILATKLRDLCMFSKNLSAVEDLPHIIGSIVDLLESSDGSKFVRAAAMELLLPSIMKLIELILTKKIKSRQFYVFISHKVIQLISILMKTSNSARDLQQANIDQVFLKIFLFGGLEVVPWLRRYAYLMLVNSRVRHELSGLFINQKQCDATFQQIRISFGQFCANLAKLIYNLFFQPFNSAEDNKIIDITDICIPQEANLLENQMPKGDDSEFDLNSKMMELPVHQLCESIINGDKLYNLQNKQQFQTQHNIIKEKRTVNHMQVDFADFLFLIDYDTGVLMQFIMLHQQEIIGCDAERIVYLNCLVAIKNLISIPSFLNIIPKHQLNKHIIFHYLSFLKFYNNSLEFMNKKFKVSNFQLAEVHLQVLIEFANSNDSAIRQHILIIKIIDFLAQQIQYESLTDAERASNKQQRTSLLPTYRANDGNSTNSDLDFGMDSDVEEKKEVVQPQFSLNLTQEAPQGKEDKNVKLSPKKEAMKGFALKLNIPEKSTPSINLTDSEKVGSALTLNLPNFSEKTNGASPLNIKLPTFSIMSEKNTPKSIDEKSSFASTEASQIQIKIPSMKLALALPGNITERNDDSSYAIAQTSLKQVTAEDMDSDSDGWGETATRLNIDLGNKQANPDGVKQDQPDKANFDDFSDSDDIPLAQPIKKMNFNINLNLGSVAQKESEKPEPVIQQLQQADLNLKMHLVLAKQSSRNGQGPKAENVEDIELENKDDSIKSDSFEFEELIKETNDNNDLQQETEVPLIPIYYDDNLHFTVIKFILILITNPKTGGLDGNYVTQFPSNNGMINIPVILHNHLNSDRNSKIVKQLIKEQFGMSQRRLLRLLCFSQFNSEYYDTTKYKLLAKGAYGEVYSGNVNITKNDRQQKNAVPVAIKLQKLSNGLHERCVLHDLFQEITVLENIQSDSNFCQLYDYGVTPQGYVIIMQRYYTSFKNFREQLFTSTDYKLKYQNPRKMTTYGHELSMMQYIRLLLLTYLKFLEQLNLLHSKYNTIHFDLKCDNIFINPASFKWLTMKSTPDLNGEGKFQNEILQKHLKAKSTLQLPYLLSIADFGESHMFSTFEDENTLLSKGTEFNKSPEMLVATNQQFAKSFNRRRQKGAGKASDFWSAACTFYEILTNDYLFYDNDWIRFFLRVTQQQEKQVSYGKDSFSFAGVPQFAQLVRGIKLSPEKQAMLGNCKPIIDLLEFQLVQDPSKRPSYSQIREMVNHILNVYFPISYQFDPKSYQNSKKIEKQIQNQPFNPNSWQFSLLAAQSECMANQAEILAPKVSIISKDDSITGTRLTQAKSLSLAYPSDLLTNNQILLGSLKDVQNSSYMNSTNVSTIIDCTINSSNTQITTISHVYRPNIKLFKIYKNVEINNLSFKDFIISLEEVFDVVRCALVKNAAVMIIDENGFNFSSCIAVACLMEFEDLYLYPAVIYLKRMRPAVQLQQKFLDFLQIWHDNRTKIGVKMSSIFSIQSVNKQIDLETPENYQLVAQRVSQSNYRCMCGKVFFVQKMFTESSNCLCNCVASKGYSYTTDKAGKAISCPSTSCRTLQNYFVSLYGLNTPKMLYCYGKNEDFISNWPRATMLSDDVPSFEQAENGQIQFRGVDNMRAPLYRMVKKDDWSLFLCRICGSPTHFMRLQEGESEKESREICVIGNISNK